MRDLGERERFTHLNPPGHGTDPDRRRLARPDRFGAAAAVLAFGLLAVHVWLLWLDAPADVRRRAPAVLAFQAAVTALLIAGAVARRTRWRAALYVLGGLGAFLYGLLTWGLAGVIDVIAAVLAVAGVAVAMSGVYHREGSTGGT
ncbi:MAG: hypothetical protein M3N57_03840 [Actinomycetota bacterium]|nr:hypothetical protein [Actinomycetota bacterium]